VALPDRPNVLKAAFLNVYNLSLLGGALAVSALTGDLVIGVVGAGLEIAWLVLGADSQPFRARVEREHREALREQNRESRKWRIERLRAPVYHRATALLDLYNNLGVEIKAQAGWSADLVQGEYYKMESILDGFLDLCEMIDRGSKNRSDVPMLERTLASQLAKRSDDPQAQLLNIKSASLIQKRIDTAKNIETSLIRAAAQMDVIENTFRLLYDQLVNMKSTAGVNETIDDVLAGVEAVRSVITDSDLMVGPEDSVEPTPTPKGNLRRIK
jgi:hypothetical protein